MELIFVFITILWIGEFVFFPSLKKEEKSKQKTFQVILAVIVTIIVLNALMAWQEVLIIDSRAVAAVGLIIYAAGLILRYWSLIILGKNFSRKVEVSREQELVSHGPYQYLRHPSYTGLFLLTTAVPLFVGNLLGFFLSIPLMYWALNRRMKEEEGFMEEVMGERYVEWKKKRYKLLPFII